MLITSAFEIRARAMPADGRWAVLRWRFRFLLLPFRGRPILHGMIERISMPPGALPAAAQYTPATSRWAIPASVDGHYWRSNELHECDAADADTAPAQEASFSAAALPRAHRRCSTPRGSSARR